MLRRDSFDAAGRAIDGGLYQSQVRSVHEEPIPVAFSTFPSLAISSRKVLVRLTALVAMATEQALFEPNPKRRYMVVPNLRMNEGQPYTYDREAAQMRARPSGGGVSHRRLRPLSRAGRSGPGSSPCSRPPRIAGRTALRRRTRHRPRLPRAARSWSRTPGPRTSRST
jgi:hypothetical protein